MVVEVRNDQCEAPVALAAMQRLACRAAAALRVRGRGRLAVTFIGSAPMRRLNRRFKHHDWNTDVLCFRYDLGGKRQGERGKGKPEIVGEILISPKAAKTYAASHAVRYQEELSRYVIHGLLHWTGEKDGTAAEQRRMRSLEDRLLRTLVSFPLPLAPSNGHPQH